MNGPAVTSRARPDFAAIHFISFMVFMVSLTFEGPLRLALSAAHLPFLIYVRDVVALAVIIQVLYLKTRSNFTLVLIGGLLLLIHNLVGLWNVSAPQVLFGDKVLLDGMFGACISPVVFRRDPAMKAFLWFILCATAIGIIYNYFHNPPPWWDVSSEVGGIEVNGIRTIYAAGVPRLAGFSRANTTAACLLVVTTLSLIIPSRHKIFQTFLLLACLPFVFLTNSKSTMICLLLAVAPYIYLPSKRAHLLKPLTAISIVLCILVPLGFWGTILHQPSADTFSLFSFVDRVDRAWPNSWRLIAERGSMLLGRGIGGIGSPQKAYEPSLFVEGDNVFIYLYGYFGALTLGYFSYVLYLVFKPHRRAAAEVQFALVLLTFCGFTGITGIIIEDQLLIFYMFAAIAILYRSAYEPPDFSVASHHRPAILCPEGASGRSWDEAAEHVNARQGW
jgi:hypothetical protein